MGNTSIDAAQLRAELAQFTGTEKWYRHGINRRMLFTDGVRIPLNMINTSGNLITPI